MPSCWNGWKRRPTSSGGITVPVLLTEMVARPVVVVVEISARPPATLWRRALSTRFATQAFGQALVTRRRSRGERCVDVDASLLGVLPPDQENLLGDLGQIKGFPLLDSPLTGGQGEQRLDETFLLIAQRQHLLAGRSQRLRGGIWVGEGHLEQGPFRGERGSQFVGGVGHEVPLRLKRCVKPPEQVVERLSEFLELVVAATEAEAPMQVAGGDVPGGSD